MNDLQRQQLTLLKEIDEICSQNGITYYAAGGTVIGAARHKGFIPWDDDIDIYMTADNYEKFRAVVNNNPRSDRKLENRVDNRNYYAVIPRYTDVNSTQVCRYHVLGQSAAGALIDIFIMDSFPEDKKLQREYLAKLNIYFDLAMPYYAHSHRNEDAYLDLYGEYEKMVEEHGRNVVIDSLETDLFGDKYEDSNLCILRWGSLPNVFKKSMFGEPAYLQFEDMRIPVPCEWYEYLVQLYGGSWYDVPYNTLQPNHTNVSRTDITYDIYMNERDRYIIPRKARKAYRHRQRVAVAFQKRRRQVEEWTLNQKAKLLKARCLLNLTKEKINELFFNQEYEEIILLLNDYYAMQTSLIYSGALTHGGWYKWVSPTIIEMDQEILRMFLLSLIYTGDDRKADKLLGVYIRADRMSSELIEIQKVSDSVKVLEREYYQGHYSRCIELFSEQKDVFLKKSEKFLKYYWLAIARADMKEDDVRALKNAIEEKPEDAFLKKAYGDYLYEKSLSVCDPVEKERICSEYKSLYTAVIKNCRNGIFWREISERIGVSPDYSEMEPFVPTDIDDRHALLMHEIVNLCDDNDIKYVLSGQISRRAALTGNLGHTDVPKTIYMAPEDAERFMDVCKTSLPPHRKIEYWGNNHKLRDFQLLYMDTNSVYGSIRRLESLKDIGVNVDIRILRRGELKSLRERFFLLKEIMLNVAELQESDMFVLRTWFRKLAYKANKAFMRIYGEEKFARNLFGQILKSELKKKDTTTDFFFRRNRTKGIYDDVKIQHDYYNDTRIAMVGNTSYRIPYKEEQRVKNPLYQNISNKIPDETLFMMMFTDFTWNNVRSIVDVEEYKKLPWLEYEASKRRLEKANRRIRRFWLVFQRANEKIDTWNYYARRTESMKELVEQSNWDELENDLVRFDYYTRFYLAQKMDFILKGDVFDIYITWLQNTRNYRFARNLIRRSRRDDKSTMIIDEYLELSNQDKNADGKGTRR